MAGTGVAGMDTEARRLRRRAIAGAMAGTSIAWYDFFLFVAAIPLVFFPHASPADALPMLGVLWSGFAGRLVGGALFGHLGDRRGRRSTLVATLLTMGLPTAAIGLLPFHVPLGVGGLILLTALRFVQGVGLGGEWAGAVLVAMEWEPDRARRGFVASLPQAGVPLGLLLAFGALYAVHLIPGAQFAAGAWRLPFLLCLPLVGACWWLRRGIRETPVFREWRERGQPARWPVWQVLRHDWHQVALSARARLSADLLFYGCAYAALLLAYGRAKGADPGLAMAAMLAACAAATLAIPLAGRLSDRYGRGPVYGIGIAALALAAPPLFAMLGSGIPAVFVAAMVAGLVVHALQYGPQAALIAEGFTPRLRYSGSALGFQLGYVPGGLLVPVVAAFRPFGQPLAVIALGVVVCCVVSASALLPPRRLLAAVGVLGLVGGTGALLILASTTDVLGALMSLAADGHSTLWVWVNNLGAALGFVGVLSWLGSRRRPRAR
jgi:MFS family permease